MFRSRSINKYILILAIGIVNLCYFNSRTIITVTNAYLTERLLATKLNLGNNGAVGFTRLNRGSRYFVMGDNLNRDFTTTEEENSEETNLYLENQSLVADDQLPASSLKEFLREKIGTVDESRMVFPEYSNGEVTRLYSNLKYVKSEDASDRKMSVMITHEEGSTLGSAALIAGSSIGAGVLALPTATAPIGLFPSTVGLLIVAGYMTVSGLLIAELTINRIGETGKPGVGLLEIYRNSLGEKYGFVGSAAYFFLHYAVMVAYIAQGGTNLMPVLDNLGLSQMPGIAQISFAAIIGSFLYIAKKDVVEKANNALVLLVIISFLSIITIGSQSVDLGALTSLENQHPDLLVDAFPVLFLSLVYHNVVPTVVTELEGDKKKITIAIVSGVAVPLIMFLAWNAVILGNVVGIPDIDLNTVDPIALLQNGGHGGSVLSPLVAGFSELAIVTSFIAMIYGLVDALTDVTGLPTRGPEFEQLKPFLFAAVLIPPTYFALGNPGIFYDALDYGGAFGVSTLFLVLPPLIAWKERYGDDKKPLTVGPLVPFGKIPLASCWKAAATLILEQGAEKLGIIQFINDRLNL